MLEFFRGGNFLNCLRIHNLCCLMKGTEIQELIKQMVSFNDDQTLQHELEQQKMQESIAKYRHETVNRIFL